MAGVRGYVVGLPLGLVSLSLAAAVAIAGPQVEGLKDRHDRCIESAEGRRYEQRAVERFWGDAAFMSECAPPGSPIPERLTIFFEVRSDGAMGELSIRPQTETAMCIRKHVLGRRFDPPPSNAFVVRIDLKFNE